ncbi:hypothetical protein [Mycobacteroides sp. PCS013]|uniref:hypothetical protein n=1 Tax=Mycobacteroides sp. PCS013 TaxID=3074106 RepID=UPI003C2B63DA
MATIDEIGQDIGRDMGTATVACPQCNADVVVTLDAKARARKVGENAVTLDVTLPHLADEFRAHDIEAGHVDA